MLSRPAHIGLAAMDGDRVVLLDIRADRYRLLPPALSSALLNAPQGYPDAGEIEALEALGLRADGRGSPLWPIFPPIERSAFDMAPGATRRLSRFAMALELLWIRDRLNRRGLAAMLAELRPPTPEDRPDEAGLLRLASAFQDARRTIPVARNCLSDTMLFMKRAHRRGLSCRMIFGVRLDPFVAHCWAQAGDLVLTDPVDRVTGFEPVYAI
jgi:hypothetical protein